jgi:hypothetical protein
MNNEKKILFYRNRSIGERLSVTADFLKQNWKVLLKLVLITAVPLALITGYSMAYYSQWYFTLFTGNYATMPPQVILFFVMQIISSWIMFALSGAIMIKYERGELNPQTKWNELRAIFFPLIGKSVQIWLYLFGCTLLLALLFILLLSFLGSAGVVLSVILGILLLLGIFAISPSLLLVFYPAYFHNVNAWDSIKIAFSLGFKDWGSIFVAIIIAIVMTGIVSVIFSLPYQVLTMFTHKITVFNFILASISALGNLLVSVFLFIYMAFQYFSIAEKEEGISLQSQIDEFENL